MFIAIIGTRHSGKSSIEDYLILREGFQKVVILAAQGVHEVGLSVVHRSLIPLICVTQGQDPAATSEPERAQPTTASTSQPLVFSSPNQLLDFITKHWLSNFVTSDLHSRDVIELFVRRPFFLLLCVDAPLQKRFERSKRCVNLPNLSAVLVNVVYFASSAWARLPSGSSLTKTMQWFSVAQILPLSRDLHSTV